MTLEYLLALALYASPGLGGPHTLKGMAQLGPFQSLQACRVAAATYHTVPKERPDLSAPHAYVDAKCVKVK